MLTALSLTNFRGFESHKIRLRPTSILVGRNNAGKSTVVEALRLISIVTTRLRKLPFTYPPSELDIGDTGVKPSLRGIEISFDSIFHQYREPPAVIEANFLSGASITIYLYKYQSKRKPGMEKGMFAVIRQPNGRVARTTMAAMSSGITEVDILPQVAPLAMDERRLVPGYVFSALSSSLAPLHFRNQLNLLYDEYFEEFKRLAESNWPGLGILELEGKGILPGPMLSLLVRDGGFVGEVAWTGHGLQMWLQTMWFLARTPHHATIILDEPDVYMHADLQRKLIRLLRGRHRQTIVTTHSIEIMEEVGPEDVLVIDRSKETSQFADSLPAVQQVIDRMGAVHNLHLTRLWTSKRFLLLEGKDLALLKRFQNVLFPTSTGPFDVIPHMSLGGWGNWHWAVGSSMTLRNAVGESIRSYCLLDSDYHTDRAIAERYAEALRRGVDLHIWSMKEIENYLLVPSAIKRLIDQRTAGLRGLATEAEINGKIEEIAIAMENGVFDCMSTEILAENRRLGSGGANRETRKILQRKKKNIRGLLALVSGKEVISQLSNWAQSVFGVTLSAKAIATLLKPKEIDDEVKMVVEAIEQSMPFHENPNSGIS